MDKMKEIRNKHISDIGKKMDEIYHLSLMKRFGRVDADIIGSCTLYEQDGIKRLQYGDEILCEIYPPTIESTGKLRPFNISLYESDTVHSNVKYRIFV